MKLEINGDSVFDDGQLVASIDGDNAFTSRSLPPAVKGRINALVGRKLTFTVGESDPVEEKAETPVPAKKAPDPKNPYNVPAGQDPRFGTKTPKGGKA